MKCHTFTEANEYNHPDNHKVESNLELEVAKGRLGSTCDNCERESEEITCGYSGELR